MNQIKIQLFKLLFFMGQQCCQVLVNEEHLPAKALTIKQKDFLPIPSSDLNHPILVDKIPDLQSKSVFHNQEENRYFVGSWKEGQADGPGTLYIPDHLIYQGTFENAIPQGQGEMIFLNRNQQYKGYFHGGRANGKGLYKSEIKKYSFEGQWMDSKPLRGILMFEQNANILKIEIHDLLTGRAHILYKDGRQYEGQINRQLFVPQGEGELRFMDGSRYSGGWKNGQMDGKGRYEWKDGSRYEGGYVMGRKEGWGVFRYGSGKEYVGNWVNGRQEGLGKIVRGDGGVEKEGIWKNGGFERKVEEEVVGKSVEDVEQVKEGILQPIH